jgi:two-component system OmpR family sensor kinase
MNTSIRRRLLSWLLPGLLLAGLVFAVPTWINVHEEIGELFDKVLQQVAHSRFDAPAIPNATEPQRPVSPVIDELDLITQKWGSDGALLYASHPFPPLPAPTDEGWFTVHWRGEDWRVFQRKNPKGSIQIAQSFSERRQTANEVALHLLAPLAFLLPGLGLLAWFGLARGLRPLQDVVEAVEQRSPDSLHPIPDRGLPREVATLVGALNGLLRRLDIALAAQRQFTADAAHELRSPLTALSLQAEVAERATDPAQRSAALKTLRQGIERASHLVHQLLTLARLDPEAAESPWAPVRLDELARTVVGEFAPLALDRDIDLGLAVTDSAQVSGDGEALRVLLGNLLDNAIRYTPAGGRVDVGVRTANGKVRLYVSDDGPGIPAAEQERVFDRFHRVAGTGEPGSGLGLAIVKRIADRHGASIRLADGASGRGLTVSVTFSRITS